MTRPEAIAAGASYLVVGTADHRGRRSTRRQRQRDR